jgi:hypothetical protein
MGAQVAIITRDRPNQCIRCARTALDRTAAESVTIIDGSAEITPCNQLREALAECGRRASKRVHYVGRKERIGICQEIEKRSGVDRDVLEFGMEEASDCFSAGSARNIALRLFSGRKFMMLDDDVVPVAATHSMVPNRMYVTKFYPRFYTYHFRCRQDALRAAKWVPLDIINELHQRLEDPLVKQIQRDVSEISDCRGSSGSPTLNELRIAVVQCGTVGDSGSYSGDWMPSQPANYVHCTREYVNTAITSREVISLPSAFYATTAPMCMAIALGLNNEDTLLPPFMPRYRNEDGVFARLVAASSSQSIFLHIPLAVLHDAPRARRYGRGAITRVSEILLEALESIQSSCPLPSGVHWIHYVGQALQTICHDPIEFRYVLAFWAERVFETKLHVAMEIVSRTNEIAVQEHGRWLLHELEAERRKESWFIPIEMSKQGRPALEGIEKLRIFMEMMGRFLEAWNSICAAADSTSQRV